MNTKNSHFENRQNLVKYAMNIAIVVILRFLPHAPNIEPIMASVMPWSKKYGPVFGMAFAVAAVVLFDLLSGTMSIWSPVTILCYAAVGFSSGMWFRRARGGFIDYMAFAFLATIFYDLATGIVFGVFAFHQTLAATITGQIPFTINHLIGNLILAAIVSPIISKYVVENRQLETSRVATRLKTANN